MKFFALSLCLSLLASVAAMAQQQPSWRDYYAAMNGPQQEQQGQAALTLYQAQIKLRKAALEELDTAMIRCQHLDGSQYCAEAALSITTIQNIDAQWLLAHHATAEDVQRELSDLQDKSQKIRDVLGF
jgi:hypothetical protein